eukprot:207494_1
MANCGILSSVDMMPTIRKASGRNVLTMILNFATNWSKHKLLGLVRRQLLWSISEDTIDSVITDWMNKNGFIVNEEQNVMKRVKNKSKKAYIDLLIETLQSKEMTVSEILADAAQFYVAGSGPTSSTLTYGMVLLAKYPKTQQMVYDELMCVMKQHKKEQFDFEIVNKLHIFRAFVYEVMRIACAVPNGLPHYTTREHRVEVDGKIVIIPKWCTVHSNSYYMLKHLDWNNNQPLK